MKRLAFQIWIHACSLLVVTPVGWCCWLPELRGQEQAEAADCCCCGVKEKPEPAKPVEKAPAPASCCCEPQPALVRSSNDDLRDSPEAITPAFVDQPIRAVVPETCVALEIASFLRDPSPPLYLLHCTWLC